jgi:hypothetical protein
LTRPGIYKECWRSDDRVILAHWCFFRYPNARYVLGETAFWDIYYEHCSYFSPGSLSRLFQSAGFDVLDVWTDYDDQYLMITAQPGSASSANGHWEKNDLAELRQEVASFQEQFYRKVAAWKREIERGPKRAADCIMGRRLESGILLDNSWHQQR